MRKKQIPVTAVKEESKSEPIKHIDTQGRADGARIFVNKLAFYPKELPSPIKEHSVSFN